MKNIDDFCDKKDIPQKMKEAFVAYMRSDYAIKFMTRSDGDTTKLVVSKLVDKELEEAWQEFIKDFRKLLDGSSSPSS